jgi:hypothetical protein
MLAWVGRESGFDKFRVGFDSGFLSFLPQNAGEG